MAFSSVHQRIEERDMRRCKFYANYLSNYLRLGSPIRAQSASEYCRSINDTLSVVPGDEVELTRIVKEMKQICYESVLPISSFEWIQKHDRTCFWVWGMVRFYCNQQPAYQPQPNAIPVYQEIGLNPSPCSTEERYECIIDFFDYWQVHRSNKITYLNNLKSQWGGIFSENHPFKWLKPDEEQCRWALEYMMKANIPNRLPSPTSTAELFNTIVAIYDLWSVYHDSKKLFSLNIGKAWSQKKHRDSLKGKKALNTYLQEETKQKLDAIAKARGITIQDAVEILIDEGYERILPR